MKTSIVSLLIAAATSLSVSSQVLNNSSITHNKVIQQVQYEGIESIIKSQIWKQDANNYILLKQTGDQNKANIKQSQASATEMSNHSYSIQAGNSNELSIEQSGTGNLLLSSQLGYLTANNINNNEFITEFDCKVWLAINNSGKEFCVEGERNKMTFTQNGNNNSVRALQQGTDNVITASQEGNFNNLIMIQKGANNKINDYKQQNKSTQILLDKIIQMGDNNSLETTGAVNGGMVGNSFTQIGSNLALELNNDLLNTVGGVEIEQKGKEMKVVVEQSFFSFPMK